MFSFLFNKEKNKKIIVLITLIYFFINLFLVSRHEAWRDEAQAWTIAKNLSLLDIVEVLPTEGHPILWFAFLIPFAKLGFSFYYFNYISLLIMTLVVYLFLKKSPFSLIVNIGVLFSSIFLFYNPVVTRIYALISLLIILLTILYKDRLNKPILYSLIVAILFQSQVVTFGLAIGLTIDLAIEYIKNKNNKKILFGLLIILFSVVLMVIEIAPRSYAPSSVDTSAAGILSKLDFDYLVKKLSNFAFTSWGIPEGAISFVPYLLLAILIILIFVFITINKSWKNNYQLIIIAMCGIGEFFAVLLLVHTSHTQISSVLTMIFLFVIWELYENNEHTNIKVTSLLLLTLICGLSFIVPQSIMRQDIIGEFSESKLISNVIENTIPKNGVLLIDNNENDAPVYSYVVSKRKDIKVFDLFNNKDFTFHKWGIDYKETSIEELMKKSKEFENAVYYLTYCEKDSDKLQLIYTTINIESIWDENYYLYKVRS